MSRRVGSYPRGFRLLATILLVVCGAESIGLSTRADAQAPDTLWTRTYGSGRAISVIELSSGDFVAAGHSTYDTYGTSRLLRTDANGDVIWDREYSPGQLNGVISTSTGHLLSVGYNESTSRDLVMLTSEWGDTVWTRSFGLGQLKAATEASNGDFVVVGRTSGQQQVDIQRITSSGDLVWERSYDGGSAYPDDSYCILQTSDGGFLVGGRARKCACPSVAWILRTNSSGDTLWTKTYSYGSWDDVTGIAASQNDGFVFTGKGGDGFHVVRADSNGNVLWSAFPDYPNALSGEGIVNLPDGSAVSIATHYGQIDMLIASTDAEGNVLWTKTLGGPYSDFGLSIAPTKDSGFIASGYKNCIDPTFCFDSNFWLVRLEGSNPVGVPDHTPELADIQLSAFPNPFTTVLAIQYEVPQLGGCQLNVFDIQGRSVTRLHVASQQPGRHFIQWDGRDTKGSLVNPGAYFLRLQTPTSSIFTKILKTN